MSVRRSKALAVGGFNLSLGRVGASLISSEEADLFERLWAGGGVIRYVPGAIVVHQVSKDRLRRGWLLRRGLAQGRTNARREGVLTGRALYDRVVAVAAEALSGPAEPWRVLMANGADRGAALNDLCRRAAHLAWACEHISQRIRAGRSPSTRRDVSRLGSP
jgi:hypothetical protein